MPKIALVKDNTIRWFPDTAKNLEEFMKDHSPELNFVMVEDGAEIGDTWDGEKAHSPEFVETVEEINTKIDSKIQQLEFKLIRPLRELASTLTDAETKDVAQQKIDEIESEIVILRGQRR